MSTITFDTLDATRRLREAGFDERQAESVVRVLSEAQSALATKGDLSLLRQHVDGRFNVIDAKFDKLTWMLGLLLASVLSLVLKAFF